MAVRAKFVVNSKTERVAKSSYGDTGWEISLGAVWQGTASDGGPAAEENRIFGDATPSGSLTMFICNPAAAEQFKPGRMVYLDFADACPVEYFNKGEKTA